MPFTVQLADGTVITADTFEQVAVLVDAHEPQAALDPEPVGPAGLTAEEQTAKPLHTVMDGT